MKKIFFLISTFLILFGAFSFVPNFRTVSATDCDYSCTALDQACSCGGVNGYCLSNGKCRTFGATQPTTPPSGGGGNTGGSSTTNKCVCTSSYGACGNYLGHTNIKYRACTASTTGTITCTNVSGTLYDYVSCGGTTGPTATTSPTNKCLCSGAYSACGTFNLQNNVKYRTCLLAPYGATGTTSCSKIGTQYYDIVSCAVAPTPTIGGGGGGTTITPGGPTPAGCQYCSTGACNSCSTYASGWKCKCDNFNGSVYSSCKGVLDPTCGVPQPTPTGVPAGMCARCTTAECGQCSDYAPGWICDCADKQGNFYKTCEGKLNPTCGVAQATPTPPCGKKSLGDADCDSNVTLKDYFYYVSKKAGVALPASVNVDFNASGTVDDADRAIVVKTLKP